MTLETYVAVTALVFIIGGCVGGTIVWLIVDPLLRRAEFDARFARNKAANAEALVRLVRKMEDPNFPGNLDNSPSYKSLMELRRVK